MYQDKLLTRLSQYQLTVGQLTRNSLTHCAVLHVLSDLDIFVEPLPNKGSTKI